MTAFSWPGKTIQSTHTLMTRNKDDKMNKADRNGKSGTIRKPHAPVWCVMALLCGSIMNAAFGADAGTRARPDEDARPSVFWGELKLRYGSYPRGAYLEEEKTIARVKGEIDAMLAQEPEYKDAKERVEQGFVNALRAMIAIQDNGNPLEQVDEFGRLDVVNLEAQEAFLGKIKAPELPKSLEERARRLAGEMVGLAGVSNTLGLERESDGMARYAYFFMAPTIMEAETRNATGEEFAALYLDILERHLAAVALGLNGAMKQMKQRR